MATGIGNLPYLMPPVSPFDTITAQETNERIANIESIATGSGIGDGAITNIKLSSSAGEIGGSWQTYTPVLTGFTLGNGTISGRYIKVGKTITGRIRVVAGSTAALGAAFVFSLPATPANLSSADLIGTGFYKQFFGPVLFNTGDTATLRWYQVSGSGIVNAVIGGTSPDAVAAGNVINLTFTYETA